MPPLYSRATGAALQSPRSFRGGIGYSYSLSSTPPMVQTNLQPYPYTLTATANKYGGGLIVPADVAVTTSGLRTGTTDGPPAAAIENMKGAQHRAREARALPDVPRTAHDRSHRPAACSEAVVPGGALRG